jgi:hypothetical protein
MGFSFASPPSPALPLSRGERGRGKEKRRFGVIPCSISLSYRMSSIIYIFEVFFKQEKAPTRGPGLLGKTD